MKKIILIVLILLTLISGCKYTFVQKDSFSVSEVWGNLDSFVDGTYVIKGEAFCKEVPQKYNPWYEMRLVNPENKSEYITVTFDNSFEKSETIKKIKDSYGIYGQTEYGTMNDLIKITLHKESCFETLKKISIKEKGNILYIKGKIIIPPYPYKKFPILLISENNHI